MDKWNNIGLSDKHILRKRDINYLINRRKNLKIFLIAHNLFLLDFKFFLKKLLEFFF